MLESFGINILGAVMAIIASMVGTFSGGGSALILFPALLIFAPYGYIELLTVAKASAAVMTFVAGNIHFKKHKIKTDLLFVMIIGGLLGTALGTYLVQFQLNEALYKAVMGMFMILSSVYVFFGKEKVIEKIKREKFKNSLLVMTFIAAFTLNILNGMFGGTGIMMTTFLVFVVSLPFLEATAYTMISYAVVNTVQGAYLLSTEDVPIVLLLFVLCGSVVGSIVGTNLQYLKGNLWIKRAAVVMMFLIGVKMLFNY